jgi:hypothetical protein
MPETADALEADGHRMVGCYAPMAVVPPSGVGSQQRTSLAQGTLRRLCRKTRFWDPINSTRSLAAPPSILTFSPGWSMRAFDTRRAAVQPTRRESHHFGRDENDEASPRGQCPASMAPAARTPRLRVDGRQSSQPRAADPHEGVVTLARTGDL